ncbi:MAG: DNA mismatch repair endonuclease MutL, partial [Rikenellaceae bacterium]
MANVINRLSKLLTNQIAAGQVVDSPYSVVKELMENSVDAGASYVIVSIKEGGKKLIQVIDDGKGMSPEDAIMAFEQHATSKISTTDDLFNINTFGFRGEALASIASVAEVELSTRREEDELGVKVSINGGALVGNEPISFTSCGSQFIVRNLFYNIPARKKSLKKDLSETKKVIQQFERVALSYHKTAFSLYADDKLLHMLTSTNNIRQRIVNLVGRTIGTSLLELYVTTSMVEIKGYIGRPDITKKRPECFFFVNGRYFESPYLYKAVQSGYEKLVPEGTLPPFFLYFTIDPKYVDVNVEAKKISVKFDEESAIWQILNAAVRESLGKNGIVPMIDFSSDISVVDIPSFGAITADQNQQPSQQFSHSSYNPFDESFSFSTAVGSNKESFRNSLKSGDFSNSFSEATGDNQDIELESSAFTQMKFDPDIVEYETYEEKEPAKLFDNNTELLDILVLNNTYTVANINGELFIFDIARVIKTVNYQKFLLRLEHRSQPVDIQKLLFPIEVSLSTADKYLLEQCKEQLKDLGFIFTESSSDDHMVFDGVPTDIEPSDTQWFIEEILTSLKYTDSRSYQT